MSKSLGQAALFIQSALPESAVAATAPMARSSTRGHPMLMAVLTKPEIAGRRAQRVGALTGDLLDLSLPSRDASIAFRPKPPLPERQRYFGSPAKSPP
jgi:hypothetical protein